MLPKTACQRMTGTRGMCMLVGWRYLLSLPRVYAATLAAR